MERSAFVASEAWMPAVETVAVHSIALAVAAVEAVVESQNFAEAIAVVVVVAVVKAVEFVEWTAASDPQPYWRLVEHSTVRSKRK